jgi:threonine dehydrogenase-like Zn-dependent dehydrogenase
MNALQLESIGVLNLKQIPVPQPCADEVLLKITHCALCRTDAKMRERGQRDLVMPRILGHECCGVLEESGNRFAVWPGNACGHCKHCQRGAENLCRDIQIIGFHRDGGFAEYAAVPKSSLIPIPDDLSSDVASLSEPLACGLNALEQVQLRPGHRVLIYGAGPVGLLLGLAVQAKGAQAFIKERNPDRLIQAQDYQKQAGISWLREQEGTSDFEAVINAAPSSDTFSDGLKHLADGGCFCLFSGLTDDQRVPISVLNEIHYRQLRVTGAYGCTRSQMKDALKILSDYKNVVTLLIENHITLEDIPDILSKMLAGQALKFVVEF